jgi:anti-sigma regulatory factor (Ser/Thr protein kinase)
MQALQTAEVELTVPAAPEYLRLARMTAAGLASRMGFTYDQVEDLRIGVDELCFLLVGTQPRRGTITLTYGIEQDRLVIEGAGDFSDGAPAAGINDLSSQILAAVVDDHDVDLDNPRPRFRLIKRCLPLT